MYFIKAQSMHFQFHFKKTVIVFLRLHYVICTRFKIMLLYTRKCARHSLVIVFNLFCCGYTSFISRYNHWFSIIRDRKYCLHLHRCFRLMMGRTIFIFIYFCWQDISLFKLYFSRFLAAVYTAKIIVSKTLFLAGVPL